MSDAFSNSYNDVYLNFINGQWKQGSSGGWESNRNPARPSQTLGKSTKSNAIDAARAVDSAIVAQTEWSRRSRPQRGQIIQSTAMVIKKQAENFAKTISREQGKNLTESRHEVARTITALEFLASESRRPEGGVLPSEIPGTFIYTTRSPIGVVAVITPYDFPLQIPATHIASALLEGNSVVFKPSSLTPAVSALLARAFEEATLPAGALNLIYGAGATVGNALVDDARVKAISFTGSREVGRALYAQASHRGVRVQLETGGTNPVIVLADADLQQAVDATVRGAFGFAGLRATATSRVLVEHSVYERFAELLVSRTRSLKVGDGLADPTAMGPITDEKQLNLLLETIENAKQEGATVLCGGERVGQPGPDQGYFLAPTVLADVKSDMKFTRDEIFGPIVSLISVQDFDHALEVANQGEGCASSSIFTKDFTRVMLYAERAKTQAVHVNSPTLGNETSDQARQFFSDLKTVHLAYASEPTASPAGPQGLAKY